MADKPAPEDSAGLGRCFQQGCGSCRADAWREMGFGQQNPQSRWRELWARASVFLPFQFFVGLRSWGEGPSYVFPRLKKKKKQNSPEKQKHLMSGKFQNIDGKKPPRNLMA